MKINKQHEACIILKKTLRLMEHGDLSSKLMPVQSKLTMLQHMCVSLCKHFKMGEIVIAKNYCIDITLKVFRKKKRFKLLKSFGSEMVGLSKEIFHQKSTSFSDAREKEIEELYPLFDKILTKMQNLSDVDILFRVKEISYLLKDYGCCCLLAKNYLKTIEVNNQAISLIKTCFPIGAGRFKILGTCFSNLGKALQESEGDDTNCRLKFMEGADIVTSSMEYSKVIDRLVKGSK